ncbi:peptidyl-prolyl cis-trans isomerase FKBP43-like isoform X2 [Papaver somniferum]|uniref:peptidyl-prolyl cis-trans isomerase FKBP43-like isoform X2 n=1 Tax=Papaver somniferum TaxID=3469 RepID=UPI000E6F9055|nr:peptidyl-prolyl cis-trans isomerase FKBP43-like isoform X2 [Papaver somniferum]
MSTFWGEEVLPERSFMLFEDEPKGRLRITLATLGKCPSEHERMMLEAAIEKARNENNLMLQANMVKARNESLNRCNVLCRVEFGPSVILCSLTAGTNESCELDLDFDEDMEVIFSVDGPHSVHLTGYYRDKRKPSEDGKCCSCCCCIQ